LKSGTKKKSNMTSVQSSEPNFVANFKSIKKGFRISLSFSFKN
jgi:hypothetical protein